MTQRTLRAYNAMARNKDDHSPTAALGIAAISPWTGAGAAEDGVLRIFAGGTQSNVKRCHIADVASDVA